MQVHFVGSKISTPRRISAMIDSLVDPWAEKCLTGAIVVHSSQPDLQGQTSCKRPW